MKELNEQEIRESFVNCTKGEASRLSVPRGLAELPWDDLDFLGWRDPGAPNRSYLVAEHRGEAVGVAFRLTTQGPGLRRTSMCSICLTAHTSGGVVLMTARKARQAGSDSDSVGEYICSDLACSLYARGRKQAPSGGQPKETLTVAEKVDRVQARLSTFLEKLF